MSERAARGYRFHRSLTRNAHEFGRATLSLAHGISLECTLEHQRSNTGTKSSRERRRLSILRHDRKTESTRLFLRLRGLNMLVDLLRSASGNRHYVYHSLAEILRLLAELLVSTENQLMWRFCVGLEGTLDLLVAVSNQRRDADSLVTLLEIPTATASTNRSYSEETTLQLREPILQVIRLDLIQRRRPLSELQQSSRLILGKFVLCSNVEYHTTN